MSESCLLGLKYINSHLPTSELICEVEECPGVLETGGCILLLAQLPEPDRGGGQGGGGLPRQLGPGPRLGDAEGGPVVHGQVLGAVPLLVVRVPDTCDT